MIDKDKFEFDVKCIKFRPHYLIMQNKLTEKDIKESIKYASYIQAAILPDAKEFNTILPDSFILYQPRDLVSGDFYWIIKKKHRIALAAADCTGHGVPGAFMSIMGINYLNLINSQCIPLSNKILNLLREHVMKALHQKGDFNEQKDGIDMTVCVIDTEKRHIEFSGANNPLIYFNKKGLNVIKGDRMPIGVSPIEEESFTRHILSFDEVDMMYIFSDGYPDQFGGAHFKKLKFGGFKKILTEVHQLPIEKQKRILASHLKDWKGENDQTDDILVLGIRINSFN